ncbi:MAG TPA: NnrU family protein [Caulobacterales bacterium]|nr:NnrU family protein [Caulobacterales bacterium]
MTNLIAAMAYFLLIHLLISGTRLRDALVRAIGQGPYFGLFVVLSFIGVGWLAWGYGQARIDPANAVYWGVTDTTRAIQIAVQLIAFIFIVAGMMTPNPTSVRAVVPRGENVMDKPNLVQGMLRITRHPFLWGASLWAAGHLLVNGDSASFILFGGILVLSLVGTRSIDAKRRRSMGEKWKAFARQTSNVPFAAILSGRQNLNLGEIGWRKLAAGVAVWAILLVIHPYLFGVPALG